MDGAEYKLVLGRIDNWVRAMRAGIRFGSCGSAERHWRPEPQGRDDEQAPFIDRHDAELIEKAWRTLQPVRVKWMIKWHFVQGIAPMGIIRMLQRKHGYGIRVDNYPYEIRCAVELLKKNIDRLQSASYLSSQQSDSGSAAYRGRQMAASSRQEEMQPALA